MLKIYKTLLEQSLKISLLFLSSIFYSFEAYNNKAWVTVFLLQRKNPWDGATVKTFLPKNVNEAKRTSLPLNTVKMIVKVRSQFTI